MTTTTKINFEVWQDGYTKRPREGYVVEICDHNRALTDLAVYCESGPYSYRDVETNDPSNFYVREWRYTKESQQRILLDMLTEGNRFEKATVFWKVDFNKT
jgi:hypothetical protein